MTGDLARRLERLPASDKALLLLLAAAALVALLLGLGFGMATGLARGGFLANFPGGLDDETGYRLMTLHGMDAFFHWLSFAQVFLLLVLTVGHVTGAERIAGRPAAWAGAAAMIAGLVLSQAGVLFGPALLYDAPPELAVDPAPAVAAIHGGYLLLAAGSALLAAVAIATALAAKRRAGGEWSSIAFAAVAWAGLLMVSAIAAFNAFGPAFLWALGFGPLPPDYSTAWHLLFHNMHYLPLLATVVVWYALVRELTGVASIFGATFSKIVFAAYLVFVPPTSLYHMFLEPDLPETVRTLGSLLSLFIGVPTVLVFLILTASLEIRARELGVGGLFGWIGRLPWRHPAMTAVGAAAVNLALGGAFSFVLIQEKLAPLLSDTFMVPGYFHFLTIGTVTLTFLAGFVVALPALSGRAMRAEGWLVRLPWLATAGLLVFGAAGIAAGYMGVPRRTMSVAYDGLAPHAWSGLMTWVGIGAAVMGVAMIAYIAILAASLRGARGAHRAPEPFWTVGASGAIAALPARAWTGPLAVAVLIAAMFAFTALAFRIMAGLPVVASGGGGH